MGYLSRGRTSGNIFLKKPGVIKSIFLKKALEFLGLLLYPWKFWTKEGFIVGNSGKLCYIPWKFHISPWSPLNILHAHTISGVFIVNLVNHSYLLLSISIVDIGHVMACNGESHATLTENFGLKLPHGQCFLYWQACASTLFSKRLIIQTLVHCHL